MSGAVIAARAVDWALGDANHDTLFIFPRGHAFKALTPDGENGLKWKGTYGFVSLTAYGQEYGPDAINEMGLYVGVYCFPDYASFATQITTASDLKNRTLYFHTMDNRLIQKLDLRKIDFGTVEHQLLTQGAGRQQVVREIDLKR